MGAENRQRLPKFEAGKEIRRNPEYRIIMGWKPGLENTLQGRRFVIEPLHDIGEDMLIKAAETHKVPSYHTEWFPVHGGIEIRKVLRANWNRVNLRVIYNDQVEVPNEGGDSIPAIGRMLQCLIAHPNIYTFND